MNANIKTGIALLVCVLTSLIISLLVGVVFYVNGSAGKEGALYAAGAFGFCVMASIGAIGLFGKKVDAAGPPPRSETRAQGGGHRTGQPEAQSSTDASW